MRLDRFGEFKPVAKGGWLANPTVGFARTCPFSPAAANEDELARSLFNDARLHGAATGRFVDAFVGHVAEGDFRTDGSSGGLVSWVGAELLRKGLVDGVIHVLPAKGERNDGKLFRYGISRSVEELRAGAKSRYYPVELSDVLREVRAAPGRYAVVGIPCFIKAVQLLRREDPLIASRILYTLGLFCGHMKSTRLIESFALQMGTALNDVQHADYRLKNPGRPASWYTASLRLRDGRELQRDWFDLVEGDWGSGFFQNSACNFCDDVVAETADISCGDAWLEPYSSDGRGTNVVIVRSLALQVIIGAGLAEGRLQLDPVDADFIERTQAAGMRQRREGLAYRLTWHRMGARPRKRVQPDAAGLPIRRKLVYRVRAMITFWSRHVYQIARLTHTQFLYRSWARGAVAVYHALAYSQGKLGALLDGAGKRDEIA